MTGKPLVAHIHSTELDRSGEHVNQPVYEIDAEVCTPRPGSSR